MSTVCPLAPAQTELVSLFTADRAVSTQILHGIVEGLEMAGEPTSDQHPARLAAASVSRRPLPYFYR